MTHTTKTYRACRRVPLNLRTLGCLALLLLLAACAAASPVDETPLAPRWRDTAVTFAGCDTTSLVVATLELGDDIDDDLGGSLTLVSGSTGLMVTGDLATTRDGESLTGTLELTGEVTATLEADLTLEGDALAGSFTGALTCDGEARELAFDVALSEFTPSEPLDRERDWRSERIYFAFTDRFDNGDPDNDDGAAREGAFDEADPDNVRRWYGGDWAGITQRLEDGYFTDLGFTAIWISPVTFQVPAILMEDYDFFDETGPFAGFHGYWAEDFLQPDPHFGTLEELQTLVETAHAQDIRIILDVIVNHTGYQSTLREVRPEWFNTEEDCDGDLDNDPINCELAELPDLEQGQEDVTAFLNYVVDYWLETIGFDGIRMDTVKHVEFSYWAQFFAPGGVGDPARVWTVGEIFDGRVEFLASYLRDYNLPSVFDFPLYYRISDHLSNPEGNLNEVAVIFTQDGLYDDPTVLTTFIDNHDVPRFVNQATNRDVSVEHAVERLDLALSFIYAARGIPSVYYGTEIALPGGNDPDNRDPMDFAQVEDSPIAARLTALASARDTYPALTHGAHEMLTGAAAHGAGVMAFRRTLEGEQTVVAVLNNGDEAVDLATLEAGGIPLFGTLAEGAALTEVTGREHDLSLQDGVLTGALPPRTLIAVAAEAGAAGETNPELANISDLAALAGESAVQLSWTVPADEAVAGYRVYTRAEGTEQEVLNNLAPIPAVSSSTVVAGLENNTPYDFRVVTVDSAGRESEDAPTVSATPDPEATGAVTFRVDARALGDTAVLEVRRFDTGSQVEYPMTPTGEAGVFETTLELPLFRTVTFKYGNTGPNNQNSGYEGFGQGDRTFTVDAEAVTTEGVYNFIEQDPPAGVITGTVQDAADNSALAAALITADSNPDVFYALSSEDGSYTLLIPAEGEVTLTATQEGYALASQSATPGDTGVDFVLEAE